MALVKMLSRGCAAELDDFNDLLRGSLIRMHDLGSIILSVTGGDDRRTTSDMHEVIFGNLSTAV